MESGLLEIVSPRPEYYPDLANMSKALEANEPNRPRFIWRTKQCLDFIYLMSYARVRGRFYIQLEDDIIAKKNFVSSMRDFAKRTTNSGKKWFILEFCQLGFIGKMFKVEDLPLLIQHIAMFYLLKPVDWLLWSLLKAMVCNPDMSAFKCEMAVKRVRIQSWTSLFQHAGYRSSLKGKVQTLKDSRFKANEVIRRKQPQVDAQLHKEVKEVETAVPKEEEHGDVTRSITTSQTSTTQFLRKTGKRSKTKKTLGKSK